MPFGARLHLAVSRLTCYGFLLQQQLPHSNLTHLQRFLIPKDSGNPVSRPIGETVTLTHTADNWRKPLRPMNNTTLTTALRTAFSRTL